MLAPKIDFNRRRFGRLRHAPLRRHRRSVLRDARGWAGGVADAALSAVGPAAASARQAAVEAAASARQTAESARQTAESVVDGAAHDRAASNGTVVVATDVPDGPAKRRRRSRVGKAVGIVRAAGRGTATTWRNAPLITALGLGGLLAHLLDPENGRRRRRVAVDRINAAVRDWRAGAGETGSLPPTR
jgi:creatinine amidohydrolase/Fe(II)-dependent formamide hydrolase-like protein